MHMNAEILKVLLVEDSPTDAFLSREELAMPAAWGRFEVVHVETFAEAGEQMRAQSFDAILLDLNLPDSDGFETFERLHGATPDIAIIVLSGQNDEMLATRAVKAGAQDYMVKGQRGLLPRVVHYAIERNRAQLERRRFEEQLVQAHKLEMVGRLSAGVAHDFNNILSVIMGYNDLILGRVEDDDCLCGYAEEIRHAAQLASGLTRQLLIFSRSERLEPAILDLNDVIRDMDRMLRRLAGEDIEFTLRLDETIGHVHADSGFIGQVIMNLVVNARDAMPGGGSLMIETENVVVSRGGTLDGGSALAPGPYVMFSVRDTGCGLSDAVRARIFEAFFTTKEKDQGTGLGLAICQNVIEQSGGYISVESELGKGTIFRVYLPRVGEKEVRFTSDEGDFAAASEEEAIFLPKPYTPTALTRKVRETLSR
jgi:signal transduction histidine kinase